MNRIRNPWRLLQISWSVLREDRELLWLPIFGLIANLVLFGAMGFGLVAVVILLPAVFMPMILSAVLGTIEVVLLASAPAVVVGLTALTAYYKTALYLFTTDGDVPEGFDKRDLQPSFLA